VFSFFCLFIWVTSWNVDLVDVIQVAAFAERQQTHLPRSHGSIKRSFGLNGKHGNADLLFYYKKCIFVSSNRSSIPQKFEKYYTLMLVMLI